MTTPTFIFAEVFTRALVDRDYAAAYAMTTPAYQQQVSIEQFQTNFEHTIPSDWGEVGPFWSQVILTDWPDKGPDDLEIIYVGITGEIYPYSEAVTVTICREGDGFAISGVEFGRP